MAVSEQSLSYCVTELRTGKTPKEVADLVKEKFDGEELEMAINYLRMQHKTTNTRKMR